jgi:monoamine oxidase
MVRTKIKNTLYPPFGYVQEHLEGPTAGSKAFLYYTPKGDKTAVTVVGNFVISGMDEKETRNAVLAQLQVTFDEDNANLKNTKQT